MKELEKFLERELNGLALKKVDWGHLTIEDDSRERTLIEVRELVKKLPIHGVSESLLRETIYLLSIKQPDNCLNWIEGVGDCNKPECEFCRIQRCIDELESNVR